MADINLKRLLRDLANPDDDLRALSAMTLMKVEVLDQAQRGDGGHPRPVGLVEHAVHADGTGGAHGGHALALERGAGRRPGERRQDQRDQQGPSHGPAVSTSGRLHARADAAGPPSC